MVFAGGGVFVGRGIDIIYVIWRNAERGEGVFSQHQRSAVTVAGFAPDRIAVRGITLLDQVFAEQAGDDLVGSAALEVSRQRQDVPVATLAGGAENNELGIRELHRDASFVADAAGPFRRFHDPEPRRFRGRSIRLCGVCDLACSPSWKALSQISRSLSP